MQKIIVDDEKVTKDVSMFKTGQVTSIEIKLL